MDCVIFLYLDNNILLNDRQKLKILALGEAMASILMDKSMSCKEKAAI